VARDRRTRTGFDYVRLLVDDHSRLAHSEILERERATFPGFPARAIDYFLSHEITRIERVMTDNVDADRGPCRPWDPAQAHPAPLSLAEQQVERLNRVLQTQWTYRQLFSSNTERAAAPAPWLEYHTTRRRHRALGGLPPIIRL
jgi:hypothetical protein